MWQIELMNSGSDHCHRRLNALAWLEFIDAGSKEDVYSIKFYREPLALAFKYPEK
jgi:hypothetical protein